MKVIVIILSLFCISCSRVVYVEKKVPIKCNIDMPVKPVLSGDFLKDLANTLKHSEILENDLKMCIGEK